MQNENELEVQIINDSKKKLLVLKLLCNFFNHPELINASIRTSVIHNLFETNLALDVNKLELFHIQYTNSLIDLFQKLKKSKEQQYGLISDEININSDFITKLEATIGENIFLNQVKVYSQIMSQKIAQLYAIFASDNESAFDWNEVLQFSANFKSEFYREISSEHAAVFKSSSSDVYQNTFATFEKKLLGRLNILKFKVKFLCGLVHQNTIFEVFEFRDSNDLFVFNANEKSFCFLNKAAANEFDLSKNSSNKNRIISELKEKNLILDKKLKTVKTELSEDVLNVLKDYNTKIASIEFLDELQNVDEQTNILKAMLNININSK